VTRRVLAFVASAFVAAVIVASFTIMQSPGTARLKKADATRTDDLVWIRNAVRSYYKSEGHLPESLANLVDRLEPARLRDPLTQAPYNYRVVDPDHFELCARFALDSRTERGLTYPETGTDTDVGLHGPGDQCFRFAAESPIPEKPRPD
jgi:hypothetical protein